MNHTNDRTNWPSRLRRTIATAALALAVAATAHADIPTEWNAAFLDEVRAARNNPPVMTRTMAILNVSMHDAVASLAGGFETYSIDPATAPAGASAEAAAASAAHTVLVAFYPGSQTALDALLAEQLEGIPAGSDRDQGLSWGKLVADAILASRADDGSATAVQYDPPAGVFWWVPTPPAFAPPLLPQWPYIDAWTLRSNSQFRAPGPPATPDDPRYTKDFVEVKTLGGTTSTARTEDQSEIARFWNDFLGSATPPGHWNAIAQTFVDEDATSLVESTRYYALISITLADAAIVSWDNKYHFHHWRPSTAITNAHVDGNPDTARDATWTSYITTPPFPTYTSGHSTFSGSASRMLSLLLGSDAIAFSAVADDVPGAVRHYSSLSQASEEAGQSRIYGGIHWQYDNRDAIAGGRALAEYVFANFLRPTGEGPTACAQDETNLCLADGRFEVRADWRSSPSKAGVANSIVRTDDSGEFTFFSSDNVELVVKVLNGCAVNGHYWVFAAGATNLEYILVVKDHVGGSTQSYFNPLFVPGRMTSDLEAFPCP